MIAVEYGRLHLRHSHFFSAIFKAGLLMSDKITDKLLLSNLAVIPRQPDPAPTSIKLFRQFRWRSVLRTMKSDLRIQGGEFKTEGDTVIYDP